MAGLYEDKFTTATPNKCLNFWEWREEEEVKAEFAQRSQTEIDLRDSGVKYHEWGAETLKSLLREVESGQSVLEKVKIGDTFEMRRTLTVCRVWIRHPEDSTKVLIEHQKQVHSKKTDNKPSPHELVNLPLAKKFMPKEDVVIVAKRGIDEELGGGSTGRIEWEYDSSKVEVFPKTHQVVTEEKDSKSYPGLKSYVGKELDRIPEDIDRLGRLNPHLAQPSPELSPHATFASSQPRLSLT